MTLIPITQDVYLLYSMTELIYHNPHDRSGVSPFDDALRSLVKDQETLIACPYLSPYYLRDIIKQTERWSLLTDVEAWLDLYDHDTCEDIYEFLTEHQDNIRHVINLHAKVVIGKDRALIGSANLTDTGIRGRTEMSVMLDDRETIEELKEWFETVWSIYNPPELDRVRRYIDKKQKSSTTRTQENTEVSIPSEGSPGRASLTKSTEGGRDNSKGSFENKESHNDLIERVENTPSPEWIYSFFDLVEKLLSDTELDNEDPRLVMSLPQKGHMPVSINNRYVLVASREKSNRTEFIISNDADNLDEYIDKADYTGRFNAIYDEDKTERPWYLGFDGIPTRVVDDKFLQAWMDAVSEEMDRATRAPKRKHHEPVFYQAACDVEYREKVIQEAFSPDFSLG